MNYKLETCFHFDVQCSKVSTLIVKTQTHQHANKQRDKKEKTFADPKKYGVPDERTTSKDCRQ